MTNDEKDLFKYLIQNNNMTSNQVNYYISTKFTKFHNILIKQNNIIKYSQLVKLITSGSLLKMFIFGQALTIKTKKHPPFVQYTSKWDDINTDADMTVDGFLTDADIANDLNVSYTKAKRMLSPRSHLKTIPKIHHTLKLWHVKDDVHKHFRFIKNKEKRINKYQKYAPAAKGIICGKNKPKIVVGVNTYLHFIKNYYDPKYTKKSQRKHILSKYDRDVFKECHDRRYTNYELTMKLIKEKEKILFYKKAIYNMNEDSSDDFYNVLYKLQDKLLSPFTRTIFTKPKYPEYKSQSHLLNKINKENYLAYNKDKKNYQE